MKRIGWTLLAAILALPVFAQEKSVRPGINDNFRDPDVKKYTETFEGESREVFTQRERIVAECRLKAGMVVADVGAGTGLFTRLFAREVGPAGQVYAVEIAPKFVEHIRESCRQAGVRNVTPVLCNEDSVDLPPSSVDVVFVCDTYHHFEFPFRTLASIHRALKPGGRLVVVDFERIPGKSREWVIGHVRAGKEIVEREIASCGFAKSRDVGGFLEENYLLCFDRRDEPRRYRVIAADKGKVTLINADGSAAWSVSAKGTVHDLHLLANGNILFTDGVESVVEMTPKGETVWRYNAKPKSGFDGKVEIHACQRLEDGLTLVAESGNRRIIEVDQAGAIVRDTPLTVNKPDSHRDTRLVRKLTNGNYLVCHEGDGVVREYDPAGRVVWSYTLDLAGRPRSPGHGPEGHGTAVYGAIRLTNGNTLIACGNGNRVIEVNPVGQITWSIDQKDLPGVTLAWVTTLHALPNGNVIIGNCHAGEENPQLIEVTRDKQVVWTFKDFTRFGNSLASAQVLDIPGHAVR